MFPGTLCAMIVVPLVTDGETKRDTLIEQIAFLNETLTGTYVPAKPPAA